MKVTNRYNLPGPVVRACEYDAHGFRLGDITITELVKPPQMLQLERTHDHEIEEDVSERVKMMIGTAVHEYLMRFAKGADVLSEERLRTLVNGWTVTGKFDVYDALMLDGGRLCDYKYTSIYAVMKGGRADWEAQLNLYAELLRRNGFGVRELFVVPLLYDWRADDTEERADYPPAPSYLHPVPLWLDADAASYLELRVRLHQQARQHLIWPPCSPDERWERGEAWAVVKYGKKRATAVFGPEAPRGGGQEEASAMAEDVGKARVEHRPGQSVRCARFCHIGRETGFCKQWGLERAYQAAREQQATSA